MKMNQIIEIEGSLWQVVRCGIDYDGNVWANLRSVEPPVEPDEKPYEAMSK